MMSKRMDGSVQVLRPQAIPIPQREVYRRPGHGGTGGRGGDSSRGVLGREGLHSGARAGENKLVPLGSLGSLGAAASTSVPSSRLSSATIPASSSLIRFQRHNVRRIFVQTETGQVVVVEVDCASGGAEKVKRSVQAALNVPTEQAELLFGGHVLESLHELRNDVPVLLKRGLRRSASSPCLPSTTGLPPSFHSASASSSASVAYTFGNVPPENSPAGLNHRGSSPLSATQPGEFPPLFEVVGGLRPPRRLQELMQEAVRGVQSGAEPVAACGGTGGAYYFHSPAGERVVIVKPTDEEPFAPNNPNGYVGRSLGQPGLKKAIRVGEAGVREVAAYLLDHNSFAGVPCTALVRAAHPSFNINPAVAPVSAARLVGRSGMPGAGSNSQSQLLSSSALSSSLLSSSLSRRNESRRLALGPAGCASKLCSLQQYVHHDYDTSECGTNRFPVSAVHRIGILDVRIFNTDRHSGNILVRKLGQDMFERRHVNPVHRVDEAVELVPIDHGFCLPETLEAAYFEWLHWPQKWRCCVSTCPC